MTEKDFILKLGLLLAAWFALAMYSGCAATVQASKWASDFNTAQKVICSLPPIPANIKVLDEAAHP